VLSPETERTDRRERFLGFTQIESLEEYVLVAQDKMEITIFRHNQDWQPEVLSQSNANVQFRSLELSFPITAFYEGITLQYSMPASTTQ
jgi:Uma2 family endonuclease